MAAWDEVTTGNIIGGIVMAFTDIIGPELFWTIVLIGIPLAIIYIKTRDVMLTGLTSLLTASVTFLYIAPNIPIYIAYLIILGVTLVVYKVFMGK